MTSQLHEQQIINAYLRQREYGVLPGGEILLKPNAMRELIHDLAALGVACYGVTGWFANPTYDPRGVFLIEDWGRADYGVPESILTGPNAVEDAKTWCLERLDNGMASHLIYIGSSFDIPYPHRLAITKAWRALPGPTYPLPFDVGSGAGHTSG